MERVGMCLSARPMAAGWARAELFVLNGMTKLAQIGGSRIGVRFTFIPYYSLIDLFQNATFYRSFLRYAWPYVLLSPANSM
jgi:hypothetical protein